MFTCYPKYNINLGDKDFDNSLSLYYKFLRNDFMKESNCDAPKPGGPLTTRQLAEILYVSYRETHT